MTGILLRDRISESKMMVMVIERHKIMQETQNLASLRGILIKNHALQCSAIYRC